MIRSVCLAVLATALFAVAPAHAQSRREMTERIDATEVRIGRLEQSFMAGDPVADTLMQRLDALEYQVRDMTGEIERLGFENRQLRQQLEQLQAQRTPAPAAAATTSPLDNEAAAWMQEGLDNAGNGDTPAGLAVVNPDDPFASERAAATGVLGGASGAPALPASNPDTIYDDARSRLLDGDLDGAQSGFEAFVADHPDDPRAGEAWYWLGETFFVRNNFAESADAYIASLRAQPGGSRAPDALVRLAASLHGLDRTSEACGTLARFNSQFPNASAASRDRAARESVRAGCQ